jgi:chemotaxis protein MotB
MAEGRRIIIKKKGGGHGHHGGAWKVAYADFVTAMMALFMVMWLLASTDQQSRKEISRYFRTGILPDGDLAMERAAQTRPSVIEETSMPTPRKSAAAAAGKQAKELGKAIERMVKSDPELAKLAAQVSVKLTEQGVLIEAVDRDGQSMLFDSASSELKPSLVAFLDKLGPLLARRKNRIQIMGHTDARPFVSKAGKTNWDLSYERATNARKVLEASGLERGQVTAVQAYGASQPRNATDPFAAENRRLAVLVLHDPEPAPGETPAETPGTPETPAEMPGTPGAPGPTTAGLGSGAPGAAVVSAVSAGATPPTDATLPSAAASAPSAGAAVPSAGAAAPSAGAAVPSAGAAAQSAGAAAPATAGSALATPGAAHGAEHGAEPGSHAPATPPAAHAAEPATAHR